MIVAIDFDGILCENQFPEIGAPNYRMISFVQQMLGEGHEVILWTCRVGDRLQEALDWCNYFGLHFSAVNDNARSNVEKYGTNPRKVHADLYIDDHNIQFIGEGESAEKYLKTYIKELFNYE